VICLCVTAGGETELVFEMLVHLNHLMWQRLPEILCYKLVVKSRLCEKFVIRPVGVGQHQITCKKVTFTLGQAMDAQRGSRGIALLFL
jgi:hypothetical protein